MGSRAKYRYGSYIACAAMSCTFMAAVNISPGIANLIEEYGNPQLVTLMMTIGPLCSIPATIITGKLCGRFSTKAIGLAGMIIILLFGIAPTWMNGSLIAINVMRAVQGIGLGMMFAVAPAIPSQYFSPGKERNVCLGLHGAFAGGGMFVYNYLAGWLVSIDVDYVFLTYLMTAPLIVLVWVLMPSKPQKVNAAADAGNGQFDKRGLPFAFDIFFFLIVIMVCTLDTSNYVVGSGIGTSVDAGLVSTIFSVSAFVGGITFPAITARLKQYTRPFGTMLSVIGLLLFVVTGDLIVTEIAAVIAGFGVSMHNPANLNSAQDSVAPGSVAMSIAIIGTANTLGQTVSTYVIGFMSGLLGGTVVSRFYISAILAVLLLIYEAAFAVRKKI